MPRYLSSNSDQAADLKNVGIHVGGTDANTAPDALANLNGVTAADINKPNGILGLDGNGKIETVGLSGITVEGPLSVAKSSVSTYTVTNYDVFSNYTVTASTGTVTQVQTNGTFTYTAPAVAGTAGFNINGRVISITVTN